MNMNKDFPEKDNCMLMLKRLLTHKKYNRDFLHIICYNILLRTIDYKLMHPFYYNINSKPFYSELTINIEYVMILSHPNYQKPHEFTQSFPFSHIRT